MVDSDAAHLVLGHSSEEVRHFPGVIRNEFIDLHFKALWEIVKHEIGYKILEQTDKQIASFLFQHSKNPLEQNRDILFDFRIIFRENGI